MQSISSFRTMALGAALALAVGGPLAAQQGGQGQPQRRPPTLPASGPVVINPSTEAKMRAEVKAPAGFDVTLFAGPPVAMYPTCLAESPDRALFVCVDPNLSLSVLKGVGRVMRLVDDNNDGRADRYTTFAEMDSPRGVAFDGETLYVMHPPSLTAYRDTNGDGISDWKKELVSGLGFDLDFRGADHTTNGITLGIDGWLYVAVGDYGFREAVGADGTKIHHRGGAVVRVRPDGSNLEIYAINTRNIYDVAVDPFLNVFTRDNTNDGDGWNTRLHYVAPGADLGYPTLYRNFATEHFPTLHDYGGGSGVGGLWIQDPAYPEGYNNTLYTADWTVNRVFRHPLTPKGASYGVDQQEFLTFIRPTDLVVDAASHLYVASLSGGQFTYASDSVGYVVRISPPGLAARPAIPTVQDGSTDAQLLALLTSPNAVVRQHAQQEILQRGPKSAFTRGLEQLITNSQQSPEARVAAMFTLKQLNGASANGAIARAASDADARIRALALRALADRKDQLQGVNQALFVRALQDADDHVKVQALNGLVRLDARNAATSIVPLVGSADQALQHLAINALVSLQARDAALRALDTGTPAVQAGALRVLGRLHDPQTVAALTQRLERATGAARAPLLSTLARLYNREAAWQGDWWTTKPSFIGPYFNPATWEGSAAIRPILRQALLSAQGAEFGALAEEMARFRVLPQGAQPLLTALAGDPGRGQAVDALIGHSSVDSTHVAFLNGLSGKGPAVSSAVAELLAAQTTVPAAMIPVLRTAALDQSLNPEVRGRILNSLMAVPGIPGTEAAVAVLAQLNPTGPAPMGATAPPVEAAWRRFVGNQRRGQELDYFIEQARSTDPTRRVLAYSVLVQQARSPRLQGPNRDKVVAAIDAGWANREAAANLVAAIRVMGVESQYTEKLQAYNSAGTQ